jgi:hypothetical protein
VVGYWMRTLKLALEIEIQFEMIACQVNELIFLPFQLPGFLAA